MKRLLAEPLLHFLVLGAALFAAYAGLNREPERELQEIVVSAGQIEHLVATFARTWQRVPSDVELSGLIDQYVREEVLSRQAIELGLDQNDTVIRRRLQQKMEFIAEDAAAATEPSDAELAAWYAQHPELWRQDPRFTFRQILLRPERHGRGVEEDAARLLVSLRAKGARSDPSALGEASLLPSSLVDEPRRAVEGSFGPAFAAALAELPIGEWSGPVRSGVGTHLVRVEARTEGRIPPFAEVRDPVRREWESSRRVESSRRLLAQLLERYRVTVQWPERTDSFAQSP
jgi:hypothetical protein